MLSAEYSIRVGYDPNQLYLGDQEWEVITPLLDSIYKDSIMEKGRIHGKEVKILYGMVVNRLNKSSHIDVGYFKDD